MTNECCLSFQQEAEKEAGAFWQFASGICNCGTRWHQEDGEWSSRQPMSHSDTWVPVSLHGIPIWVTKDVLAGTHRGSLAHEHHVKNGRLDLISSRGEPVYAFVQDGEIHRHQEIIGTLSDLIARTVDA